MCRFCCTCADTLFLLQMFQRQELLMIGHCLRGLALLGKGKEAENVFARVAIM